MSEILVDYRLLPIANQAAKTSFDEETIENDSLLKDILHGNVSLEDRLESLPKFSFSFDSANSSNKYDGSTIQDLKNALSERKQNSEKVERKGVLSSFWRAVCSPFRGLVLYDRTDVVNTEELSLEEKRDKAIEEIKQARDQEKVSKRNLEQASSSLNDYIRGLEARYQQDVITFPHLGAFAKQLQSEIDGLQDKIDGGALSYKELETYQSQIWKGQDYFNRLVNEMGYLRKEMDLLGSSKEKYTQMLMRLNSLVDKKGSKLRESLVKIKEAEMTRDLSVIVEAADCLLELDAESKEIDSINSEINQIIEAAFNAVDNRLKEDMQPAANGDYRKSFYRGKVEELDSLIYA